MKYFNDIYRYSRYHNIKSYHYKKNLRFRNAEKINYGFVSKICFMIGFRMKKNIF